MGLSNYRSDLTIISQNFSNSWKSISDTIIDEPKFTKARDAVVWLVKIMECNVPEGKKNRALAMIYYYQHLVNIRTQEDDFNSYVVGWCIEVLQATALIADDIMDGSLTRRGVKCWYLRDDVGPNAINDVLMLQNTVYFLLQKYLRGKSFYTRILEIFHETVLLTTFGQCMDSKMSENTCNFDGFTIEKYKNIVDYKTGYYSFYLPLELALALAGETNPKIYKSIEDISLKMGYLFQVQDDFLDCYGDSKITGKIGTDIQDGKCTWLIIKALAKATKNQIEILKKSYGSKIKESEADVKGIFIELEMAKHFQAYETKKYLEISKEIDELPSSLKKEPLHSLLDCIYQRKS